MPFFPDLRAAATAATVALALVPAAAQAADIERPLRAYDFNGTLGPSAGSLPLHELPGYSATTATTHDFDAAGPEAPRSVRAFDAGDGFSMYASGLTVAGEYGIVLYARLDTVSGARRLIDLSDGTSDAGLYAVDGDLVLRRPGTSDVAGTGTRSLAAGEWAQIAFSNEDGDVRAWIDGVSELTGSDEPEHVRAGSEIRFFADDGAEESAGQVARIRLFDDLLTSADIADLDTLDRTPPAIDAWSPLPFTGTFPEVEGDAADGGTPDPPVTLELRRNGTSLYGPHPMQPKNGASFAFSWTGPAGLDNGPGYEAVIVAVDRAGNRTEVKRPFTVDGLAPTGLSLSATPAQTDDNTPRIAGSVPLAANDDALVYVNVYRGRSARHGDLVASLELPVTGGTFGQDLAKPLATGDYTVRASHFDAAYNEQTVSQGLRITNPRVVTPPTSRPPRPVTPPVPPVPPAPALPTPAEQSSELMTSALAALKGETLRGLRDGARVPYTARTAGTAIVQLWLGNAPKKVVTARAAAKKKGSKGRRRAAATGNLLAAGSRGFRVPGTQTIDVALTKTGRKALRNKRSVKVTVRTIFVPGGSTPAIAVDRPLTLKR